MKNTFFSKFDGEMLLPLKLMLVQVDTHVAQFLPGIPLIACRGRDSVDRSSCQVDPRPDRDAKGSVVVSIPSLKLFHCRASSCHLPSSFSSQFAPLARATFLRRYRNNTFIPSVLSQHLCFSLLFLGFELRNLRTLGLLNSCLTVIFRVSVEPLHGFCATSTENSEMEMEWAQSFPLRASIGGEPVPLSYAHPADVPLGAQGAQAPVVA
jgi:hypothetical protein